MSRLVSYFSLTLLFTLCACFVDYAFVIVVIKESYYYYYYYCIHDVDEMFVTAMVWKKLLGLRSEFGRQLKKEKKPSGSAGGCSRPWKFLRSLSFLRSVIVPRKTEDNLTKPQVPMPVSIRGVATGVYRDKNPRNQSKKFFSPRTPLVYFTALPHTR